MPVLNEGGVVGDGARRVGDQGMILGKPKPFLCKSLSVLAAAEQHDGRNDLQRVPKMPSIKRFERISLGEALFRSGSWKPRTPDEESADQPAILVEAVACRAFTVHPASA